MLALEFLKRGLGFLKKLIEDITRVLNDKSKAFVTKEDVAFNINKEYYRTHFKVNKLLFKINIVFKGYRMAYIEKKFCVINNITNELEGCYIDINEALKHMLQMEELYNDR